MNSPGCSGAEHADSSTYAVSMVSIFHLLQSPLSLHTLRIKGKPLIYARLHAEVSRRKNQSSDNRALVIAPTGRRLP
eukprot:7967654-Pyramimonas_sp.AAC.1